MDYGAKVQAIFRFCDYSHRRPDIAASDKMLSHKMKYDKVMHELVVHAFNDIHRTQLAFHDSDWNTARYMYDYNELNRTTMVLLSLQFEKRGYNFRRCVEGTYFMTALYGDDLYAFYNQKTPTCFAQCRTPCYDVLVNTEKHDDKRYQFKFKLGCLYKDPAVFMLIHQHVPTFKLIVLRLVLDKIKSGIIEGDVDGLLDTLRHEVADVSIQDIEDIDDSV